jgi:hypothetical protein
MNTQKLFVIFTWVQNKNENVDFKFSTHDAFSE